MPKCELLRIEMPIGERCPSIYSDEEDICYLGCGFSEDENKICFEDGSIQPVKDITLNEARKAIIKFIKEKRSTSVSEIAEVLPIDISIIISVIIELKNSGNIKICE